MTRKPATIQKITPHLWFDKEAREAAEFYTDLFPKSKIKSRTTLQNTPSGTVEVVTVDLMGQEFMLLSAGPLFKFNESISFVVRCKTQQEIDYTGKGSRLCRKRSSADGSRTSTACRGRSFRQPWTK